MIELDLPLAGKRILVTRPKGQASQLADRLEALGAIPVALPAIEILPPEDYSQFDQELQNLDQYDWVIFTSVNGVRAVAARMDAIGIPREQLSARKLAVIGPATADLAKTEFRAADLMPKEYISESISAEIGEIEGQSFLLLRADIARKDLAKDLVRFGGKVTEVAVYRIVRDPSSQLAEDEPKPDYITLTSSSSVHATLAKLRESGREVWMRDVPLACIGPITAQTVIDLGFQVSVAATEYTIPGLVDALVDHAGSKQYA